MIDQLRQLIRRFIVDGIAYADFRQEVVGFQSAADSDLPVENLYNAIEGASSACEHGYIDIGVLKAELSAAASPHVVQTQNARLDFVLNISPAHIGRLIIQPTSNSSVPSQASAPSNRQAAGAFIPIFA